jgi:signal transduction histidine kinase
MRTAAHQLKSPLTGIQMLATLIADAEVRGPAIAGVIDKIIRRCREAIEQVEELLTLARIRDAPDERHRVARTPLGDALTQVWEHYADLAGSKQQELLWRLADGPLTDVPPVKGGRDVDSLNAWCVRVDSRDLEDCLDNLLDNAVKYTPKKGRITISCAREGDWAVVRVRDTGPGIDPELQESIFDEFRRGHHALAARTAGTGLGLTIVREIVEQAGGRVSLRSPVADSRRSGTGENPGSEFELRLPLCPSGRAPGQ